MKEITKQFQSNIKATFYLVYIYIRKQYIRNAFEIVSNDMSSTFKI